MRELLNQLHAEGLEMIQVANNSTLRDIAFAQTDQMIKVAMGMRRVGKSMLLYQKIQSLLTEGVSPSQILLLNFEDDRLRPLDAKTAGKLLDTFYELYPDNHHRRCYFFLDEIHVVTDWHLVVRRFFDTKNVQLYLSGSSAKLLSSEIHTSLRGRSLATEVWPYSFAEYTKTHHFTQKKSSVFGKKIFDMLFEPLRNYLFQGGFPAVQDMTSFDWRSTLQSYVEIVMMRDIAERYEIGNIAFLRHLIFTLLKNTSTHFSVNKFFNDAKSLGYKIAKDTVHLYLKYVEDAFLCFFVPIYSQSERAAHNQTKKIYAIDTGLVHAVSLQKNNLYGKLFENLVYLDLRRQHKKIYFYKTTEGFEIDFVTVAPEGECECIQVCWDTSDEQTLAREERALKAAEKELNMPSRLITPYEYLRHYSEK